MRAVFLVLLTANLLFLAWARWIDTPREDGAEEAFSRLPRLQLVTESGARPKPTAATPELIAPLAAQPSVPSPAAVLPTATDSMLASAEKISLHIPQVPPPAAAQSCASVGPFSDIAHAARAAGLLSQRGYRLQQRAEEGETIEGYWVFVGGLESDDDVGQVVSRLEKSGFTDAHVMKNYSSNRRVSVGMFSTLERAQKRAAAIKNMGLQPEIGERKFPGTVYWVDVALERARALPPEYLFADIGQPRVDRSKVEIQPCPAGLRPAQPVAPEASGPQESSADESEGVLPGLPRTKVASAPKAPSPTNVP